MAERKSLPSTRIDELASKPKVKRIAVVNFLSSVSANESKLYADMNLSADARSYKWNAETVRAIKTGIAEYFAQPIS